MVGQCSLRRLNSTMFACSAFSGARRIRVGTVCRYKFKVEKDVRDARPADFDALALPGGVANPDLLRLNAEAITFIKQFGREDKPIAAICHGPWTLIDADLVKGLGVTSWPSLKVDLSNAGAQWTDEQVVVAGRLVTSRKPDDIPAFNQAILQQMTARQTAQAGAA